MIIYLLLQRPKLYLEVMIEVQEVISVAYTF